VKESGKKLPYNIIEKKMISEKKTVKKEKTKETNREIIIEYINDYHRFLLPKVKEDGSILSDYSVIKQMGISKRKVQEFKKELYENGILEKREGSYKVYIK